MNSNHFAQFGFSVSLGGKLLRTVPMQTNIVQIGSLPSCQICINEPSVSKVHALVEFEDGNLTLTDLGSSTGTKVNGEKVVRASLKVGDVIACGNVELKLVKLQTQRQGANQPTLKQPAIKERQPVEPFSDEGRVYTAQIDAIFDGAIQESKILRNPLDKTSSWVTILLAIGGAFTFAFLACVVIFSAKPELLEKASFAMKLTWSILPFTFLAIGVSSLFWGLVKNTNTKSSCSFDIGDGTKAMFPTDSRLPLDVYPLVRLNQSGHYEVLLAPNFMEGDVFLDGHTLSLREAAKRFKSYAVEESAQMIALPVKNDLQVTLRLGLCVFRVTSVPCDEIPPLAPIPTQLPWALFIGSTIFYALWVVVYFLIPLKHKTLSLNEQFAIAKMVLDSQLLAQLEKEKKLPPPKFEKKEEKDSSGGQSAKRAKDKEGAAGTDKPQGPKGRYETKGPKDNKNPIELAKTIARDMSANSGVLGLLKQNSGAALKDLNGADSALGNAAKTALGNLKGIQPGEDYGVGGLGLVGAGQGGGGTGEGTVGLGNLDTIGKGQGAGGARGYGNGKGNLKGRRAGAPDVYQGIIGVRGTGDKEIIRKNIRSRSSQTKFCYESTVPFRMGLTGRFVILFTIGPSGKIIGDVLADKGDLGPEWNDTVDCVKKLIRRIDFPQNTTGGSVAQVSYPFVLRPSFQPTEEEKK